MSAIVTLEWPEHASEALGDEVHRVVHAVSALGGAVGWLSAATREQSDAWLQPLLHKVGAGNARLCVARVDGVLQALGTWTRNEYAIFTHRALVGKIMAHPDARGLGLGKAVTSALIEDARAAGIETLTLAVRGNNHLAVALYEELGFTEWGRLRNVIEIGDERYDSIEMSLVLQRPQGVILKGSDGSGPGSSPAPEGR